MMESHARWDEFKRKVDVKLPKLNATAAMDLEES
jgi:hypothetical protein